MLRQIAAKIDMITWNVNHAWNSPTIKKVPMLLRKNGDRICFSLAHKQLETHGWVLSTVAIDVSVPKHQAISTHTTEWICRAVGQFHKEISHLFETLQGNSNYIIKQSPYCLGVELWLGVFGIGVEALLGFRVNGMVKLYCSHFLFS